MSTPDLTTTLRAAAPVAPGELRERVLAVRPVRSRRRVRPVLVLGAAAVLAVAAALVHGLATSAPRATTTVEHGAAAVGGGAATAPSAERQALAPHAVDTPAPSAGRLQHTDASIRVRVDGTDALARETSRATRIASALGGYAQSVVYRTPQGGGGASYVELRIPAQHVKQALAQLAGLGVLLSQQISIEDLTATLQRQSDQIAQLRRRIVALQEALRNPALPESQRVLLQIKLAESKRALAQRSHGRKGTITAGTTARVSLVLTTQKHAAVAPPHRGRLGRMLHSALGFLAVEAMVVLFVLIVASPFVLALGLLWLYRRRAVERLLME